MITDKLKFVTDLSRDRLLYVSQHETDVVLQRGVLDRYVPFYCPVCESCMKTKQDEDSYEKYVCCYACEIEFVLPNPQRWIDGWRPTDISDRYVEATVSAWE